jgi:monovalent cation:H+ antiporter-2, CPA2 family
MLLGAVGTEVARTFVELGAVVFALALLARAAARFAFSPIPLFLVAGLLLGEGGLAPLSLTEDFIELGAEIGVILLLFMLGLEYSGDELRAGLRQGGPAGAVDVVLNFVPGVLIGLALGWDPVAALLLGGVVYNTSSGIMAKVLADLDRLGNRETPAVLTLSVMEDLTNTVYLPVVAVLLIGAGVRAGALSLAVALATVAVVLLIALRYGDRLSRVFASPSDEVVLLTTFGAVLLVAGFTQMLQVSSAIGAFLLGIALSGPVAERARVLLGPLRDLFAATFFLFFGFQIDPGAVTGTLALALALALVTTVTKVATGWWAARRLGAATRGRFRAGFALVPRGEFSVVIAGLGVAAGVEPTLGALAASYVLILAVAGPLLTRFSDDLVDLVAGRLRRRTASP